MNRFITSREARAAFTSMSDAVALTNIDMSSPRSVLSQFIEQVELAEKVGRYVPVSHDIDHHDFPALDLPREISHH